MESNVTTEADGTETYAAANLEEVLDMEVEGSTDAGEGGGGLRVFHLALEATGLLNKVAVLGRKNAC